MINFKWGILAAVFALVISASLGIASGVNPVHIFLRSLVFTVLFFGFGTGARILINIYFPELLYLAEDSTPQTDFEGPGSIINITLSNIGDYAVPEKYKNDDNSQELGNIEDLISGNFRPVSNGGIDRRREEVYNNSQGSSAGVQSDYSPPSESAPFEMPVFTPSFGGDSEDLGGLPDLGSMAMAFGGSSKMETDSSDFTPFNAGVGAAFAEDSFSPPMTFNESEPLRNKGNKAQPMQGDFDPKILAEGIRTVLSRDK